MKGWNEQGKPVANAVWVERLPAEGRPPGLAQLRHPGHAWLARLENPRQVDVHAQTAAIA